MALTPHSSISRWQILATVPEMKSLLRHGKRLYSVDGVPEHINKHNRRMWARSVALLGDRWVYAVPVTRKVQS